MTLYKNTSLSKLMDLKVDVAFDQVFGSAHQGRSLAFECTSRKKFPTKNPTHHQRDSFTDEKNSILDPVQCLTKNRKN